jgi:hypothetical protein
VYPDIDSWRAGKKERNHGSVFSKAFVPQDGGSWSILREGNGGGRGAEHAGEEIIETKFMVGVAYGRHVEAIISFGPEG